MRRLAVLFLAAAIAASLFGCAFEGDEKAELVSFYYRQSDVIFSSEDSVITREFREVSEQSEDTAAILETYLQGPQAKELENVFPEGCRLVNFWVEDETAEVRLSKEFGILEGMDLTIACACLARTVMGLTDAKTVRIGGENILLAGTRYVEMRADNLLLSDSSAVTSEPTQP